MATESMFNNIFDVATSDNVAIRDNAIKVAQLNPGRASVYGAAQAGGMFMQNLAGMAGMKSPEQEKAEIVTNILQQTQGLDRNNPEHLKKIASEFINNNLPGLGQQFLDKARTLTTEAQTQANKEKELQILQQSADANTSQAATAAYSAETGRTGVENQYSIALKRLGLDEYIYEDTSSIDVWKHKTQLALQETIAENNLSLGREQNDIGFYNANTQFYLAGLKPQELAISEKLAENDRLRVNIDAGYKAGQLLYQDATLRSQNSVNDFNQAMGGTAMNVLLPDGTAGVGQMVYDPETRTASFKLLSVGDVNDAEGNYSDILMTGTASQISTAMSETAGLDADEQRILDNIEKDYDRIFKSVSSFGETYRVPTEGREEFTSLTEVPSLMEYARFVGTNPEFAGNGYQEGYLQSKQWELMSKGRGLTYSNLHKEMVDSSRMAEQPVSDEIKTELATQYPQVTNMSMMDTEVDLSSSPYFKNTPKMSLANAIRTINSHTIETSVPGTLRYNQIPLDAATKNALVSALVSGMAEAQPAPVITEETNVIVPETNAGATESETVVTPQIEDIVQPDPNVGVFESMVASAVLNERRTTDKMKYYDPIEFPNTDEGREQMKNYNQWRFKNANKYRKQGITLPVSKKAR
jgi:hypothetical protein